MIIDEITVDDSVARTKFSCDLTLCKGACCTFPGGRGAPLRDDEVSFIAQSFPIIEEYLPAEHRAMIQRAGLVDGNPGNYATQCVDGKACVFVYYDGEIAKCAFERAYHEKKISWPKPLSCHLFPIRHRRLDEHAQEIHYEYFSECEPALAKGNRENTDLHRFVSAPLQRAFGESWISQLNDEIKRQS